MCTAVCSIPWLVWRTLFGITGYFKIGCMHSNFLCSFMGLLYFHFGSKLLVENNHLMYETRSIIWKIAPNFPPNSSFCALWFIKINEMRLFVGFWNSDFPEPLDIQEQTFGCKHFCGIFWFCWLNYVAVASLLRIWNCTRSMQRVGNQRTAADVWEGTLDVFCCCELFVWTRIMCITHLSLRQL